MKKLKLDIPKAKRRMKAEGINQTTLGEALGVSRARVSQILTSGCESLRLITRLAHALSLSPKGLLIEEDSSD